MTSPPSPPAPPTSGPASGGDGAALQARLVEFALAELVRANRASFTPLWTQESWAKLLIWLALNCGCAGERDAMEAFAAALGPALCQRLRGLFFRRELEDLGLQLLADPAEEQVLVLPLAGGGVAPTAVPAALERAGLQALVAAAEHWHRQDGLVAIPWARCS